MRNIERADLALSRAVAVAESLRQRHAEAVRTVERLHEEYQAALDRWVPQGDCPQCEGDGAAHDGGPCPFCIDLLNIREASHA